MSVTRIIGPILFVVSIGLIGCSQDNSAQIESHRTLAGELQSNGLYEAAIDEYVQMLEYSDLGEEERGNLNYLIARLYFDELGDYANAAAYYVRASAHAPNAAFSTDASKNLVASLEKLGNVIDARRNLAASTNLDSQPRGSDDLPVAKIGAKIIWLSEINRAIRILSPEQQSQVMSPEGKLEFVRQYVELELLHSAAVREGLLDDPEIQRQQEQLARRFIVDRFMNEKILSQVRMDQTDVLNFYEANKETRYGGAAFDSISTRVGYDYRAQKAEAVYAQYIEKLFRVEQVQFLDQNVK